MGSFEQEADALTMQINLRREGFDTYILKAMVAGVNRFRVAFGDYKNRLLANNDIKKIQDSIGLEVVLQKR